MSRLMLKQEYPPTKVQPQPSATRDDGATRLNRPLDYDKIDAEAGSILIALANQEPQRLKSEDAKSDNNHSTDGDGDVVMTNNNQKAAQNGNDMQSVVSGGNPSSSSSMSISSLLGGGNGLSTSNNNTAALTSDRPSNRTNGQRAEQDVASDPIMLLAAAAAAIDGRSDESAGLYSMERPEKRSTGASYGYYSQHYTQPAERPNDTQYHKAKSRGYYYEKDVDDTHSRTQRQHQPPPASLSTGRASRYHSSDPTNQSGARPEGTNAFSYQYMSMKQNPRIKRNAMHAYITYMIYTDMAQRDRAKTTEKISGRTNGQTTTTATEDNRYHYNGTNGYDRARKSETSGRFGEYSGASYRREMTSYVPSRSSERYHRNNGTSTSQASPVAHGGLVHSADHYHHHHQHHPTTSEAWYPPTTSTSTSSSSAAYRLPPSPSTPQPPPVSSASTPHEARSSQQSSPSASVTSGNSNPIMMGKPLTAFLRDEHHSGESRRPLSFPFTSQPSSASNGRHNLL